MEKQKTIVSIVLVLVLGYIAWSQVLVAKANEEIAYLHKSNKLKREIIATYESYERAVNEVLLHNSCAGWDSLNIAKEKLDSLCEHEL